jgi:YfiH family protein
LPRQTHGNEVLVIDEEFISLGEDERVAALHGVDAVVTALPRTCIGVSTADCIPLLLHDTRLSIVAAVHAGWRGTVANIAAKCIEKMQERYGCQSKDITAIIGPGISLDAFEIGDEVYAEFSRAGFEMGKIARRYPAADGGERWHIDLWEANRLQLIEAGLSNDRIEVAGICTWTRHEEFFSARRLGINSGRIFNGIMLK